MTHGGSDMIAEILSQSSLGHMDHVGENGVFLEIVRPPLGYPIGQELGHEEVERHDKALVAHNPRDQHGRSELCVH